MKKISIALLLLLSLVTICYGETYSQFKTAGSSSIITDQPAILGGLIIKTDGTNAVTLTVYNNDADSGQKLTPTMSFTGTVQSVSLDVQCSKGIYVAASSSGAFEYTVYYKSR